MAVKFDLSGLKNLQKLGKSSDEASRRAMQNIAHVYLSFVRKRYNKFSKGGGDWKGLDKKTIKLKKSNIILKDNGILFNALTPGANGSMVQSRGGGKIRVGFSNAPYSGGGNVTYQQLAAFHDEGAGALPKREIFAEPDNATKTRLRTVLKATIETLGNQR